jgi:hypothetical protein
MYIPILFVSIHFLDLYFRSYLKREEIRDVSKADDSITGSTKKGDIPESGNISLPIQTFIKKNGYYQNNFS